MRGWFFGGALTIFAAVAATGSAASCSLIVDTSTSQCQPATFASDCANFSGFRSCNDMQNPNICVAATSVPACTTDQQCAAYANAHCDTAHGVCNRPCAQSSDCGFATLSCQGGLCVSTGDGGTGGGDGGMSCAKNSDCNGMGMYYVCRKQQCVSLVTPLCSTLYSSKSPVSAGYQDDNAVIFGSILPTAANADGPYGKLVEDSIKMALDDFRAVDGIPGLSGTSASRPLVLVGCNDGVNEDQTDVAAHHLIDEIGVPAIIGYAFSGNTIQVAKDVTIPTSTLLFSPSATSAQITALSSTDNNLVWRTCPSDDVQAQALTLYYPSVVSALKTKYTSVDPLHIKVAIVNHADPYGSGLGDALQAGLHINGKAATDPTNNGCAIDNSLSTNKDVCYARFDYGMSTSPDLSQIAKIVAFQPDVIFLFGFNEGPDQIFSSVEQQWVLPTDGHRPFWVFSDGGEVASLWASSTNPTVMADITTDDQRQRVSGTVPGVNATSWAPYGTFLTEFNSSGYSSTDGSADTIGPAGAYDILYLLAYATVMNGSHPLTGANLVANGLTQMSKSGGTVVQIDRTKIQSTFPVLTAGPINIHGVSGPLPFNGKGDLTTADIQIWCVPPNPSTGGDVGSSAINSGFYFDSANNKMTGCMSTSCTLPGNPASCP